MRGLSYLAFLVCLSVALGMAPESSQPSSHSVKKSSDDPSNMFMKRDYQVPEPIPQDSYSAPVQDSYAPVQDSYAEPPPADNGYYYYYHPIEEQYGGKVGGKDGCGGAEKLLAPLILITIFVGIMAANDIGLIPQLQLPPITIPALPDIGDLNLLQKPDLGNLGLPTFEKPDLGLDNLGLNLVKPDLGTILPTFTTVTKPDILNPAGLLDLINGIKPGKRDLSGGSASPYYDYIPWGTFNKLTSIVLDAIESDECSARLVCEAGKYAEGRSMFLSMMDIFTPEVYRTKMSIFKDSALKKSNCKTYKCPYVDSDEKVDNTL